MPEAKFRRILLKLSGEALMGDLEYGADPGRIADIVRVTAPTFSSASCSARAFRTVASIPM